MRLLPRKWETGHESRNPVRILPEFLIRGGFFFSGEIDWEKIVPDLGACIIAQKPFQEKRRRFNENSCPLY
jgi:hypothetical protein